MAIGLLDLLGGYLGGLAVEETAKQTGIEDALRPRMQKVIQGAKDIGSDALDFFIPSANAAEADSGSAPAPGFGPNQTDLQNTPIQPALEVMTPSPDWTGAGRGVYQRPQSPPDWTGEGRGVFDPARMSNREIAIEEEAMQTASDLLQMGGTSMADVGKKAAVEAATGEGPGFLSAIKNFIGDEEKMLILAQAFNTMRTNRDDQLGSSIGKRLETLRGNRQTNRTADVLLARGMITENQAEQIRLGVPVKDVLKGWTPLSNEQKRELGLDPNKFYQIDQSGKIQGEGGQVISLGQDAEAAEKGKAFVSLMQANVAAGQKAGGMSRDLQILRTLGQSEDMTQMPSWVLQYVPRGMNTAKDAYESVMIRVALAMKEAGTGAMSDKDFDRFIATAGDIAANPAAKAISQQLLAENARIIQEKTKISQDYIAGNLTKKEANDKINALNAQGVSDDLMKRLDAMVGGRTAKPAGGQVKVISVE